MIAPMARAVSCSETSVEIYQTTRYNIPEDILFVAHFTICKWHSFVGAIAVPSSWIICTDWKQRTFVVKMFKKRQYRVIA
jgi:hypothetical protein